MTRTDFTGFQMGVSFLYLTVSDDYYDPDGYFFRNGFDEFGGTYDDDLNYHPGPKNIHEFPDYVPPKNVLTEDELIRQFEAGHTIKDEDDDYHYYHKKGYIDDYSDEEE